MRAVGAVRPAVRSLCPQSVVVGAPIRSSRPVFEPRSSGMVTASMNLHGVQHPPLELDAEPRPSSFASVLGRSACRSYCGRVAQSARDRAGCGGERSDQGAHIGSGRAGADPEARAGMRASAAGRARCHRNARCPDLRKQVGASMRAIECVCAWMARLRDSFGGAAARSAYSRSVKEVIQPQVPLRLPCYDFAPVTALAFGRLAPCGFRHGLRALTASMA
jgi:hypothetical protein